MLPNLGFTRSQASLPLYLREFEKTKGSRGQFLSKSPRREIIPLNAREDDVPTLLQMQQDISEVKGTTLDAPSNNIASLQLRTQDSQGKYSLTLFRPKLGVEKPEPEASSKLSGTLTKRKPEEQKAQLALFQRAETQLEELQEMRRSKIDFGLKKQFQQSNYAKLSLSQLNSFEPVEDAGQQSPNQSEGSPHRINVSKRSLPGLLSQLDKERRRNLPPINPFAKQILRQQQDRAFHKPKLSADLLQKPDNKHSLFEQTKQSRSPQLSSIKIKGKSITELEEVSRFDLQQLPSQVPQFKMKNGRITKARSVSPSLPQKPNPRRQPLISKRVFQNGKQVQKESVTAALPSKHAITAAANSKSGTRKVSRRVSFRQEDYDWQELSTMKSSKPDKSQHLRQEQKSLMDLLASATDFATKVQLAEKLKESESSQGVQAHNYSGLSNLKTRESASPGLKVFQDTFSGPKKARDEEDFLSWQELETRRAVR